LLPAAECGKILVGKASGKLAKWPELDKALEYLRSGDVLVITRRVSGVSPPGPCPDGRYAARLFTARRQERLDLAPGGVAPAASTQGFVPLRLQA